MADKVTAKKGPQEHKSYPWVKKIFSILKEESGGKSFDTLAEEWELSRSYTFRLVAGQTNPSLDVLVRCCKSCGLRASEVLNRVGL